MLVRKLFCLQKKKISKRLAMEKESNKKKARAMSMDVYGIFNEVR